MRNKVHLDFLCTGFQKCGTTSLFAALKKNDTVFIPAQKETFFCKNMNRDTEEQFKSLYPKERTEGKITGGIEPTYYNCAGEVYDYFGRDIKLIFCMDNPLRALLSSFMMHMRDGSEDSLQYYEKYGTDFARMFEAWIPFNCSQYHYSEWIKEYLHYYDQDNIFFLFCGDLYNNPDYQMELIQEYIGIIPEKRLTYKSFPHNNRGSRISKDLVNMMINRAVFLLWLNEKDTAKRIEIDRARIKLFDITTVEAGRDIFEDVIKRMNSMFMDDIKYVEDITGRDLHGEWY